jgi:DNA-binding CsgD family transcriptional regulator
MQTPPRLTKLTDAQKQVLRRWHVRQSAKQIARELGITHWAVNERLRTARRVLGASSSSEAAELLITSEQGGTYNRVVYEPPALAAARASGIMGSDTTDGIGADEAAAVQEAQMPYRHFQPSTQLPRLPVPRFEGERNDLSISQRLIAIGAVALAIIMSLAALVAIAGGVVRIWSQFPNFS